MYVITIIKVNIIIIPIIIDVIANEFTDAVLLVIFPPASTASITTDIADPIAPDICLRVLFIAVASSTSEATILIVHVIDGVNPSPAPVHRNICVIIIYVMLVFIVYVVIDMNPIMEKMDDIISTFFIPILSLSTGPMKLNRSNTIVPGSSINPDVVAE